MIFNNFRKGSNTISVIFIVGITFLFSCQPSSDQTGEFNLLPQAQEFEILGTSKFGTADIINCYSNPEIEIPVLGKLLKGLKQIENKSDAQIIYSIDKTIDTKPEGYKLVIDKKNIIITGKDDAGLFYGFMTLEQLMEDAAEQKVNLPLCSITDYPSLAYRSIHIDIKHHRERLDYYYRLMDKLAKYKVNGIIAEVEDKIQYTLHPEIGSADALSIWEWQRLSEYAMERNIEISPLVQGLGHASFILKHDKYKSLRDDPDSDWAFNPLDPKTYELQFSLYKDAIEATPHGKYLHVGGDEVHTTGRGSEKSSLELQLIWLNKVCLFAEQHGRIPIFWDDMPLKFAGVYSAMFNTRLTEEEVDKIWTENEPKLLEFLDQFPKNCIYMRWNYSSPEAIGNSKAMEWFREKGLSVMGATAGQTRWVLMPQNESNMESIRSFALPSIENGLNGLLLTLWDDDSPHFELYQRGIIAFAEYTWSGDKRTKDELKSAYRQREFSHELSDKKYAFIDQLEKPVAFWKNALLKGNRRNYLAKSNEPTKEFLIDLPNKKNKGDWSKQNAERLEMAETYYVLCDSIAEKINIMKSKAKRNLYTLEVYEQVNKLVQFSNMALLLLKEYDQAENEDQETKTLSEINNLSKEFVELRKEFEHVYAKSRILNKPDNYILDQDHHVHLANQSINFDWQFRAEMLFLEKLLK